MDLQDDKSPFDDPVHHLQKSKLLCDQEHETQIQKPTPANPVSSSYSAVTETENANLVQPQEYCLPRTLLYLWQWQFIDWLKTFVCHFAFRR